MSVARRGFLIGVGASAITSLTPLPLSMGVKQARAAGDRPLEELLTISFSYVAK